MFYAVVELVGDRRVPTTIEALVDLGSARMWWLRAPSRSRIHQVDLEAGWTERAPGYWVHPSGAEVRQPTTAAPSCWRYCPVDRVVWEETRRGRWFARWAALRFQLGPEVDANGRQV
jgi:hypothetical protein